MKRGFHISYTILVLSTMLLLSGNTAFAAVLTIDVTPTAGGFVDALPQGPIYEDSTQVTLTAYPSEGYVFDHWEGDVTGTANPTTVTMTANKTVTAVFVAEQMTYTLTLYSSPAEGGSIGTSPAGPTYDDGTQVTLTALPNEGYQFDHWEGDSQEPIPPLISP